MKIRQLLIVVAILINSSVSHAAIRDIFDFSVLSSVGVAEMTGSENTPDGYRFASTIGGSASFRLDPKISLEAQLGYALKGNATDQYVLGQTSVDQVARLHYLHVPINLRYIITRLGTKPVVTALVGGYGSYLIAAKEDINGITYDRLSDISKLDYGLVIGLGVDHKKLILKRYKLTYEIRYELGVRDVMDRAKNRYLSVGLRLGL